MTKITHRQSVNKSTDDVPCIENPIEQVMGRKPARHLAWSENHYISDLRKVYSLFPKHYSSLMSQTQITALTPLEKNNICIFTGSVSVLG